MTERYSGPLDYDPALDRVQGKHYRAALECWGYDESGEKRSWEGGQHLCFLGEGLVLSVRNPAAHVTFDLEDTTSWSAKGRYAMDPLGNLNVQLYWYQNSDAEADRDYQPQVSGSGKRGLVAAERHTSTPGEVYTLEPAGDAFVFFRDGKSDLRFELSTPA